MVYQHDQQGVTITLDATDRRTTVSNPSVVRKLDWAFSADGKAAVLRGTDWRIETNGESLLDSKVTKGVLEKLVGMQRPADDGDDLTAREREVLVLIAEGATNKEIAAKLVVSENTARNHVSHILSKLGFNRRSEAAAYAAKKGLMGG